MKYSTCSTTNCACAKSISSVKLVQSKLVGGTEVWTACSRSSYDSSSSDVARYSITIYNR
jgi:hypothetical protein